MTEPLQRAEYPATRQAVAAACDDLRRVCQAAGLSAEQSGRARLALDELGTNVVAHARPRSLHVLARLGPDELEVVISSDGPPFDPAHAPLSDLSAAFDKRPIGGLGLHITRAVVDRLEYRRVENVNLTTFAIRRS